MEIDDKLRIRELEKKVEELSYIHGICDKFGTYQSLRKDADIIMFFLANSEHKRRYIEVITTFLEKGWGRTTIEKHLRDLTELGILKRSHLPGEYFIAYDLSNDIDALLHYLLGDSLYRFAKKSWEKGVY